MHNQAKYLAYTHVHLDTASPSNWVFLRSVLMVIAGSLTWAPGTVCLLLLELMTHRGLVKSSFMLRHECCCKSSCRLSLPALRWIIHVFPNSVNCLPLSFLLHFFAFCPYIPVNPVFSPFLPPFWSRCTVILLPSHMLQPLLPPTHTHAHTDLHFCPKREVLMNRNHIFFYYTLSLSVTPSVAHFPAFPLC